jgi:hypothetical protein
VEELLPKLSIAPACTIDGKFLVVRGELRTYKIHLGCGTDRGRVPGQDLGNERHAPDAPADGLVRDRQQRAAARRHAAPRTPARLESSLERPTERSGFRHDPIIPWVRQERFRLLRAALTVLRAHVVNGMPGTKGLPALGSYEAWSAAIRAPLVWLGEADPALTQRELAASADSELALLAELIDGWEEMDPAGEGFLIRELLQKLELNPRLFHVLRSAIEELCPTKGGKPPTSTAVGKKLQTLPGPVRHHQSVPAWTRNDCGNSIGTANGQPRPFKANSPR